MAEDAHLNSVTILRGFSDVTEAHGPTHSATGRPAHRRPANLTAPRGCRYAVMTCVKAAGNEAIGFHAWAFHRHQPWARVFDHATPEQLGC